MFLSAQRVGPTGLAYGLDMTDEMLDLARQNQAEAGVDNVQWLRGQIEAIPLPRETVDVVISNCVINLSGDKARVMREVPRVLKPGPRRRRLGDRTRDQTRRRPLCPTGQTSCCEPADAMS